MKNSTVLFLLLAIISWGSGAFFDKLTLKHTNSIAAFLGRTFLMVLFFIPLLLFKISFTYKEISNLNKYAWIYLTLGVFVTMSGVFFYLKAMETSQASKVVPLSSTYPLITVLLAFLFLNETITISKLLGTIFISFGIYLIVK